MKSIVAGLGRVVYSLIILLLSVIASRILTVEWYAFFKEFFMYFLIGITVSGIPATNSIFYFTKRDVSSYIKTLLISFISLILVFLALLIFRRSSAVFPAFILSVSSTLFLSLEAVLLSKQMMRRVFTLNILEAFSVLMPIFLVLQNRERPDLFFTAIVVISLFKVLLYFVFLSLALKKDREKYDFKKIFSYSFPLYLNGLFGAFSRQTDKYIVSLLCSPGKFAEYSTGAFEVPLVSRFFGGVFHERGESIRHLILSGENERVKTMLSDIFRKSFPILSLLTLFLFINAEFIMNLLFTSEYSNAYRYFIIYLTVLPLRVFPFGFLLSLKGETKRLFAVSLLDAGLTLLLSFVFLKIFGTTGPAFAFVFSTMFSVVLLIGFMRDIFPVASFVLRYSSLIFFILASFIFSYVLKKPLQANIIILAFLGMELMERRLKK
ncbi:MAG: lipopolysaccharide biosynthesis protein [bacterium]